ncbi:MAG: hypothetical protein HUJ68_08060 [Clostridia bacterium]|nr:hypothetical protein [Clostridia bacterium]
MKKMLVIIAILSIIFIGMVIYRKNGINTNNVTVNEINNIENYVNKIYMWKEITNEALPTFDNINNASEKWIWEVVNQNLEKYEITYEDIELKAKEIFGDEFNVKFPEEGSETILYNEEKQIYYIVGMGLDSQDDSFLLNKISKSKDGYIVQIVEYLADYSDEDKITIRNIKGEEKGKIGITESETAMHEIVKNNIDRI